MKMLMRIEAAIYKWETNYGHKPSYVMLHPERAAAIYREWEELSEAGLLYKDESLPKYDKCVVAVINGVEVRESVFCPLVNSAGERIEFFILDGSKWGIT